MSEYPLMEKIARIIAVLFLAAFTISLIYLGISQNESLFTVHSPLLYPALVCLILFVCILGDGMKAVRGRRTQAKTPLADTIKNEYKLVAGVFLCIAVYVLVLKFVTLPFALFPLATIVCASAITVMINDSGTGWLAKSARAVFVSALLAIVVYYSFSRVFGVILP